MGIDAGFDMVPPLSRGAVDRHNWYRFIDFIKEHYKNDPQVEIKPNYIDFKAGEHPKLPFEGHKFLRFSSKVSGPIAAASRVESYIDTITQIARVNFGSRIRYWDEGADQYGEYDWNEVNESIRSYEQPDEPEVPTSIAQFVGGTDPLKDLGIPLFEIKEIPGKGRGLVARFDISKGTRILCEKPLIAVRSMPPRELEPLLAAKLKALSKESQRQFLTLHNKSPGKFPFSGTFKTNALPCGSGSRVGGVYPTACFINHSCVPNSHNSWNSDAEHETIHAVRRIERGEEITISYYQDGTAANRQQFLKENFGFDCNCDGCSLPPAELQASDARRLKMKILDDDIGDPFCMARTPKKSLDHCRSLLQVLKEEYNGCAGALDARLYYDAFQISVAHGDQARASIFAERAYKARVICEGEDSPETRRVKSLALKPTAHDTFGVHSMKWRTTREMMPKGLDAVQFDKWLFMA